MSDRVIHSIKALFDRLDHRLLRDLRNLKACVQGVPERIVEANSEKETVATTT